MVAPVYSNKKGIYSDLYREIESENKKKKVNELSSKRRPKGIYKDLYIQIENKEKEDRKRTSLYNKFVQSIQKMINLIFSKASYFASSVKGEIKMLTVAWMVAKKPIRSYIENRIKYQNINQDCSRHPELISGSIQ